MSQWEIFCSYANADQVFVDQLKSHFAALQRLYPYVLWSAFEISPGEEWEQQIQQHLNSAQVILLLVSPAFMASDYSYSKEMKRAMERHDHKEACVIPILLRPVVGWQEAPFGKLQALPTGGKPITDRFWHTQDEAFFSIMEGIRRAIETMNAISSETVPRQEQIETTSEPDIVSIQEDKELPDSLPVKNTEGTQLALRNLSSPLLGTHSLNSRTVLTRVQQGNYSSHWQVFRPHWFLYILFFTVPSCLWIALVATTPLIAVTTSPPPSPGGWVTGGIALGSFGFIGMIYTWKAYTRCLLVLLPEGIVYRSGWRKNETLLFEHIADIHTHLWWTIGKWDYGRIAFLFDEQYSVFYPKKKIQTYVGFSAHDALQRTIIRAYQQWHQQRISNSS